jgi:hypothetical protein
MRRPRRYRLRLTIWLIRRVISVLDVVADLHFRWHYPCG